MRILSNFMIISAMVHGARMHKTFKFKTRPQQPSYTGSHELGSKTYATASSTIIDQPTPGGLKVKVTSREMIKPFSPTPLQLKTVKFSLLDQLSPYSLFNPMILFYQNDPKHPLKNPSERSTMFKKSLSETLIDFYPLAGRVQDNVSIDCNDDGVEFCEADVSETLAEVIDNPNLDEIAALLPFKGLPRHKNIVLSVQLSHFRCGGTAISMNISHKIADGTSSAYFLKAWASKAAHAGRADVARPEFNIASIFPPSEDLNGILPGGSSFEMSSEKIATKRVIFSKKKLDELRALSPANTIIQNPSKVELVSAFIWKSLLDEAAAKLGVFTNFTTALHAVNVRPRMVPPLKESSFGNLAWLARTHPIIDGNNNPDMIDYLRKSFRKIDYDYLKPLLSSERDVLELSKEVHYLLNGLDNCVHFTSLCRFPLYDVDFGMGRPVWACLTTSPVKNMVFLFKTKCGEGIEAWFHLRQDDIPMLDHLDLK